ncbi:MAG TPA: Bpu10I family restriction endonuclease [Candidatus Saccharimonadales bacterium]|nr:Bpu10I family restriction endonuclease [Candidatus Saccharimonadales bacterium]
MAIGKKVRNPPDDEELVPVEENSEDINTEAASPEEIEAAAKLYAKATGGDEFPKGPQYPHAGNIAKKIKDHQGKGTALSATIDEIFKRYSAWRKATFQASGDKSAVIAEKVRVFDSYSSFLDTKPVDAFDSRGALVSSALEEFCYYLLKPMLDGFPKALLGKQNTYQGLYFTAANFKQLLKLPTAHTPVNTLDFIIGAHVQGMVKTDEDEEKFAILLPAVAVECKGYLDRPRFIESQNMARAIKSAFPQCLYILIAQCCKLNLKKIGVAPDIDGIYVWRRMQNIDRKIRREKGIQLKPLHTPAVEHFYDRVQQQLTDDWQMADPFGTGILK